MSAGMNEQHVAAGIIESEAHSSHAATAYSTAVLAAALQVERMIDFSFPKSIDTSNLNASACSFHLLPTIENCKPWKS